jgi:hypothetical protein
MRVTESQFCVEMRSTTSPQLSAGQELLNEKFGGASTNL